MEPIIKMYMTELNAQMEETTLKVCHSYGIDVEKERLMQALTDARKFYDEGYRDGKRDAVRHGRWVEWWPPKHMILTGEEMLYRCSICDAKYADVEGMRYCPNCGAKMEEVEA